jgi:hypothetical protein
MADQPTWLRRNWPWFMPAMALAMMGLCCTGASLGFLDIFGRVRGTAVYQMAMEQVVSDQRVIAQLGQPIEPAWLLSGQVETSDGSGDAQVLFNISGPGGNASVRLEATMVSDQWTIDFLHVYTRPKRGEEQDITLNDPGEQEEQ